MTLPKQTVQRLSRYRRLLYKYRYFNDPYIFSHDIARLCNLKPVQVRRDLMLIGSTGNNRMGYKVNELIELISRSIDSKEGEQIVIVGMGKLGQAVTDYLSESEMYQKICAVFDIDTHKTGMEFSGIRCRDMSSLRGVIRENKIYIAILAVPHDFAVSVANILTDAGIKGILNFTSERLSLPENVYVHNFDIITTLEEVAYFIPANEI